MKVPTGNPSSGAPEGSEEVDRELTPLPPKGSKMTAFEYFNHPYFFHSEEDRKAFVKWFEEGTTGSPVEDSPPGTTSSKAKPLPNKKGKKDGPNQSP